MRLRWLVVLFVVALGATACDWAQVGSGPEHLRWSLDTSISPATVASLHLAWTAAPPNDPLAQLPESPIVVSGTVYLPADNALHGYDAAGVKHCGGTPTTCTDVWTGTDARTAGRTSPSSGAGHVFVGSSQGIGDIYAYDRRTTSTLFDWNSTIGTSVVGAPTYANGFVYATNTSEHPGLFVFEAEKKAANCDEFDRCSTIWTADAGNNTSEPTVAGGVVYLGTGTGLAAFDAAGSIGCGGTPKTCTALWNGTGGGVHSIAATADRVYTASTSGVVSTYDAHAIAGCSGTPKSCSPLWTAATGSPTSSSLAVAGNMLFLGSSDGKLYAFDARGILGCSGSPKTCSPLWTAATGGAVDSSPSVANGVVYVGSDDGKLYAFDVAGSTDCGGTPKTCTPLWSYTTGGPVRSSPAIANGFVYVGSDDGNLYAFSR